MSHRRLLIVLATSSGVVGCAGYDVKPPPIAAETDPTVFWRLELDHQAVTLAMGDPYDTLTVTAVPRNYFGEPIQGLPAPQYSTTNLQRVLVIPDGSGGVLHAQASGAQVTNIIARLTVDGVTHADTLFVRVMNATASPPVLADMSIDPVPPDSAKLPITIGSGASGPFDLLLYRKVVIRATDTFGNPFPMTGLPLSFRSSDPTIAKIDRKTGVLVGQRLGTVSVSANITAYGVQRVDTVSYRVGLPLGGSISFRQRAGRVSTNSSVSDFVIASGGVVSWSLDPERDADTLGTDVVFAPSGVPYVAAASTSGLWDLMAFNVFGMPGSGDILRASLCSSRVDCDNGGDFALSATQLQALRVFPQSGVYQYHAPQFGVGGRITVVEE